MNSSANLTESKYVNKLVQSSDKYLLELNKIKRYSDKSIDHFIKVYKGFDKSKSNHIKVQHSTNILNLVRDVKNKIFEELATIVNDVMVESYDSNVIHYKFIENRLFTEEFKRLEKLYVNSITKRSSHNIKFVEKNVPSVMVANFKKHMRDISTDIVKALEITQKFLRKKKKLQSTWSKTKKTANNTANKLKSLAGVGHGRKFQAGKLAFGGLSLIAAGVLKSGGFAIPGAYVLNKRREINNELNSKYLDALNKSRKLKNDIDNRISSFNSDRYWNQMFRMYESVATANSKSNFSTLVDNTQKFSSLRHKHKRSMNFSRFGGGGSYTAKKKTNIILGDNPGGVEQYAIKRKNKLLTGITNGAMGLGMDSGDKILAMPISGRGNTIINKGSMTPSSFGAGTGLDESENGVSLIDVAQSQLSILTQIRNDARSYQKETLALKYDELNRSSGMGTDKNSLLNVFDPNATAKKADSGNFIKDTLTVAAGNFLGNGALEFAKRLIPFGISMLCAPATLAVLGTAAVSALGYFIQKGHTKEFNQGLTKDATTDAGGQGEYSPYDDQANLNAADAIGKKAKSPLNGFIKGMFGTSNADAANVEWGGWNAKGGYFRTNKPTLIGVGENGPEDVFISPVQQSSSSSRLPMGNNKKPLNVVVTEDKSRQALEQTALLKDTNKLTQELAFDEFNGTGSITGFTPNALSDAILGTGGTRFSGGGSGVSGGNKENAKFAMDYLMSKGESKENAAAAVGNFLAESGMNPSVKPGDGGTSFGIMQLHDPQRKANFKKFTGGTPIEQSSLQQQLDFYLWEKQNTHSKVGMMLQNPNLSVEDRAKIIEKYYESPRVQGQISRQNNARALADGSYFATGRKNLSGMKGSIDASVAAQNALQPTTLEDAMLSTDGFNYTGLAEASKSSMTVPSSTFAAPTNTKVKEAITNAAISKSEVNNRSNSSNASTQNIIAPTANVVNNNGGSKGSSVVTTSGEQDWLKAMMFSYIR